MPFFIEGLSQGEKVYHIIDSQHFDRHLGSMAEYGINVQKESERGALEVRVWEEAYFQDGYFNPDRMLQILEEVVQSTRKAGFPMMRLMGNMEWANKDVPGVERLVEYEARINHISPRFPDPLICVYDLNQHSARTVMNILRAHPMILVGGVLQENPLYIPPDELLKQVCSHQYVTN